MTYSGHLRDWYTVSKAPTQVPKEHFSSFNKTCVGVAINDFTMHLIIL